MANSIASTYFIRDKARNRAETHEATSFIYKSLTEVKGQLDRANDQLARYKEQTGLIAPDEQLTKEADNQAALELELLEANSQADAAVRSLGSLS